MTPKQVIDHFGSVAEAVNETGFTRQAFSKWILQEFIPLNSQWEIKHLRPNPGFKKAARQKPLPLKIGKPYCKGDL